MRRDWGKH